MGIGGYDAHLLALACSGAFFFVGFLSLVGRHL
jgi:hypothetical protein